MVTVEAIRSLEALSGIRPLWNELVSNSDGNTPFMSFEWFSFFWPKFCLEEDPLILILRKNGEPQGIVPLVRKKIRWRRLPVARLGFMANYFSIRTGVIARRGAAGENLLEPALRFLRECGYGFDIFVADMVVKGSATEAMLGDCCARHGFHAETMPSDSNPFILVKGTWEEYLATRSKHQRFNVRHLGKMYERGVNYAVRTYTSQGLEEAAQKLFFVSRNSWKFREGTAICNDPGKMDFYRSFLDVAARAGWLRLKILEIDGKAAAFSYELTHMNRLYILKIGYNDEFRKLAPGVFLMNRSIREAFDARYEECELLGAGEEWKLKMCDHLREHVKYWIFNSTPYGRFLHAWETRVVAAAKYLAGKRVPASASALPPAEGDAG